MTYDHTDAEVPMMREVSVPYCVVLPLPPQPATILTTWTSGAVGYVDGQPFAQTYPPRGMRCS